MLVKMCRWKTHRTPPKAGRQNQKTAVKPGPPRDAPLGRPDYVRAWTSTRARFSKARTRLVPVQRPGRRRRPRVTSGPNEGGACRASNPGSLPGHIWGPASAGTNAIRARQQTGTKSKDQILWAYITADRRWVKRATSVYITFEGHLRARRPPPCPPAASLQLPRRLPT